MMTPFNIDSLTQRLRDQAARRGTTMSALVETGLRRVLAAPDTLGEPPKALPPLPTWNSNGNLMNIDDRDALYRAMEEDVVADLRPHTASFVAVHCDRHQPRPRYPMTG